ncbi:MAG: 50S ribosomal protein L29 [Nitrospinaceae bacterium]
MKSEEIRDLSQKERDEKISDLQQEYFNLRFQLAAGKIENPSRLRLIRRDIARLKTIQREIRSKEGSQEPLKTQSPKAG